MQKRGNSGNSKYYSFGHFRDSFVHLETLDRVDKPSAPPGSSPNTGVNQPVQASVLQKKSPLSLPFSQVMKRTVDISFSLFIIVCILSWLIPIFAILIKMGSKGPVFFLQKRTKLNGEVFTCIKFRTMVINEEADIQCALENDTRITRAGSFMRKHFLDELPQFFNVLNGDMSIIGPRPHMLYDSTKYLKLVKNYSFRHSVKPGITGLSQIYGKTGQIGRVQIMKDLVRLDIFYVLHWSPGLDCKILLKTIGKMLGL